jgi:hypothetical protein
LLANLLGPDFEALASTFLAERARGECDFRALAEGFDLYLAERFSGDISLPVIVRELAMFDKVLSQTSEAAGSSVAVAEPIGLDTLRELTGMPIQLVQSLQLVTLDCGPYLPVFGECGGIKVEWAGEAGQNIAVYARNDMLCAEYLSEVQSRMIRLLAGGAGLEEAMQNCGPDCIETKQGWFRAWVAKGLCNFVGPAGA